MIDPVTRARSVLGLRFRAQGRDAAVGLDCVGLAIHAYGLNGHEFRRDYRLRGGDAQELRLALHPHFRRVSKSRMRPGDLLMMRAGPDQLHLGIASDRGLIHADAALRKIVERPGGAPWSILGVYRRRIRQPR